MSKQYEIRWSETAIADLDSILEYIAAHDCADKAVHVYDKLLSKIDSLAQYPNRCRIVPELKRIGLSEFRELIVSPYRICFRTFDRDVVLVSVLDGRRDLEQILIDRALSL